MTKGRISGAQLTALLLAGRLSSCLLLPSDSLHALTVPDLLVVTVFNAACLLVLSLPLWRYRPPARVSAVVYPIIGLFVLYLDLLQFRQFADATVKADFSVTFLTITLIAVGFAAALYGLQAVGRTAFVVLVGGSVVLLVLMGLLLPQTSAVNFPPSVFSGFPTALRQTVRELPRTAELLVLGALYSSVNGNAPRAFARFVGLNGVLTLLVCIVTTAVLGDVAGTTAYPFYSAAASVRLGAFSRVDLALIALWLSTFFVRIALFATVVLDSTKARVPTAIISVAALSVMVVLTRYVRFEGQWQLVTVLYWVALLISTLLPLFGRKRV